MLNHTEAIQFTSFVDFILITITFALIVTKMQLSKQLKFVIVVVVGMITALKKIVLDYKNLTRN